MLKGYLRLTPYTFCSYAILYGTMEIIILIVALLQNGSVLVNSRALLALHQSQEASDCKRSIGDP
jgi:hypothetical protein